MIGSRFDGPVEQINYFPQELTSNRYEDWKKMENNWWATVKPNQTLPAVAQTVIVDIKPQFSGSSKRPNEFHVQYSYAGTPQRTLSNAVAPNTPNSLTFIIPNL